MRILVDIPDDDIGWLDRKASEEGISRAALVRNAIAQFRANESRKGIERYFGLWKKGSNSGDGLERQQALRAEWDRNRDQRGS